MPGDATERGYDAAIRVMFSGVSVADGMRQLTTSLRELAPHPVWEEVESVALAARPAEFARWLEAQLAAFPSGVSVLWFCLPDMGDALSLCMLRQWRQPANAADHDAYRRVACIDVPSALFPIADERIEAALADASDRSDDVLWMLETCVPLAWSGLMAGQAMRALPVTSILGRDSQRRIDVFFAEGDQFALGDVTADGFRYLAPPSSG